MADSKWAFEVIDADEVQSVPRGRKSNIDPTLVDALRSGKAGQAIRIPSEQCDPTSPTTGRRRPVFRPCSAPA